MSESAIREAMRIIWRNTPEGPSTFSPCKCGRDDGRGGGLCIFCGVDALAKHVGDEIAGEYRGAVRHVRRLEHEILGYSDDE